MASDHTVRLPEEYLDNLEYALRTAFQPSTSLLDILKLCHAAIVLLISVGHTAGGRKRGRELFARIATRITSSRASQQGMAHGNDPANASVTRDSVDLDSLAKNCLKTIDREEMFYTADTTFRNRDDQWEEMFAEEDSIFPDALVQSLAQFNITEDHRSSGSEPESYTGLFRLRR